MPRQKFSISCFGSTGRAAAAAAVGRESGVGSSHPAGAEMRQTVTLTGDALANWRINVSIFDRFCSELRFADVG